MAATSIKIKDKKKYNLPAPLWRKGVSQTQTILTGENVQCDMYYPKIQLVDSELIDNGILYLQFGRITDKDYSFNSNTSTAQIRENGIKWYTPYPNPFETTSGIVGGGEINDLLITTRTNLIPITAQFQTLPQAVPYWQFYKTRKMDVFDGIVANGGRTTILGVPYMTGCKSKVGFSDPTSYLPGQGLYNRRPKRPLTRHRPFSTSMWFCRLIVIEDGRVKQIGDISTPIIVRPNELPFNEETISSSPIIFGNLLPIPYGLKEFKAEELTKYRI